MTTQPQPRKPDGRANNGKGTYPSKAERDDRASKALVMRHSGATFGRIAAQLNISEQMARNDVARMIRETVKVPAADMVARQRGILNDIVRVEYAAALDPSSPRHYQAQDKILEALNHEAKLFGLFAPAKVSLGISEADFAQMATELLQVVGTGPLRELAGQPAVLDAEVVESPGLDGWAGEA
jgi:hypothetical protein